MERSIIVTDLTRLTRQDIVCTAGIDARNGECIRPMPYLKDTECKRLNILPGAILTGDFTRGRGLTGPHQEDNSYRDLKFAGPCTSEQFKKVLMESCFPSVEEGFEIHLLNDQKHIPKGHPARRSIITIAVKPTDVKIVEDKFKLGKIKIHFSDHSGHLFSFIGVTDLGFHDFAQKNRTGNGLIAVNDLLQGQDEVFLRVGLSREFAAPDGRIGYWLQVNGIYTFPHFHEGIRSYSS
jgi:hypothetical protein